MDDVTQPLNLDYNIKCDKFAVCGYSNSINVYDTHTKKLINTLESR